MDEGVELAVLAAGIDIGRQIAEQILVERAAHEDGIEGFRVHTDQHGLEAETNQLSGQLIRVQAPDGEDRLQTERRHLPLPIGADVLQEEVPEGDVTEAIASDLEKGVGPASLI